MSTRQHIYLNIVLAIVIGGSAINNSIAQTHWSVLVSEKSLQDEAVTVCLDDLQNIGETFGISFSIKTDVPAPLSNVIIVGDASRNRITENWTGAGKIHLQKLSNAQGYEILANKNAGYVVVSGGSLIGDVYGLYWLMDRIRVYKKMPDINVKREPALGIRYSRISVKSRADIRRALRHSLNVVYGQDPLTLIPWDAEPERTENQQNRIKTRELINYAHSLHIKFLTFGTDFTYHPSLLKKFGAALSPCDPLFWSAVQGKYRMLLQALPELDGVATFTGEEQHYMGNYRTFDVMHGNEDCAWSLAKRYRTFVNAVYSVVVGEFGKIYHQRTWITNAYEQQSQPEVYEKIFTDAVPINNLYLIPSFTQHDRWWFQAYNPTFNLTPHNMLAVFEQMNYYESSHSNIFPTFPGQYFQAGLQSVLGGGESNLRGASFDLYAPDDFKSANLTAYTVFRLEWDYNEDVRTIAADFAAIHFGEKAAKGMAEIYWLSPIAYKYGLFVEPVAYGAFNSLPLLRVGTFPAQGMPSIDHGKEHIEFLRKIYLRCKPWLSETLAYLDHGLAVADTMRQKYNKVRPLVEDQSLAQSVENELEMTKWLIKTNNLYVKTFFAYFEYREKPNEPGKTKLFNLFTDLKDARGHFTSLPEYGYHVFGVDQLLINVQQALDDLAQAERLLAQAPDRDEIERRINYQQKQYALILQDHADQAVKFFHFKGKIDGRDILALKSDHYQIEHLRWDPAAVGDANFLTPLPGKSVAVIPGNEQSRAMHPFVLQQPTKENNYTAKVYLYDVPGGSDWWTFDLYFIPEEPERLGLQ